MADYIYLLENRLSPAQKQALTLIRQLAREKGLTVFLVGGAVRDLTSGSPVRDLDVVVQGNALKIKKEIEKAGGVIEGELVAGQALFVRFPGGARLELGSTLSANYPKPGKPVLSPATILEDLRRRVARKELADVDALLNALARAMTDILKPVEQPLRIDPGVKPYVILVVGINGAGKTTTIGKLAHRLLGEGRSVMLAAGDTFRAAAREQLEVWAERNKVPIIAQQAGAEPAEPQQAFGSAQPARRRRPRGGSRPCGQGRHRHRGFSARHRGATPRRSRRAMDDQPVPGVRANDWVGSGRSACDDGRPRH